MLGAIHLRETIKTKRLQQILLFTHYLIGNKSTHTEHFIAVITVSNDTDIFSKVIKHWKTVGSEATDATARFTVILTQHAFETLLAMSQGRHPHVAKFRT